MGRQKKKRRGQRQGRIEKARELTRIEALKRATGAQDRPCMKCDTPMEPCSLEEAFAHGVAPQPGLIRPAKCPSCGYHSAILGEPSYVGNVPFDVWADLYLAGE